MIFFRKTHLKDGIFAGLHSEKIHSDVTARIAERQTQLTQQALDGVPVELCTIELNDIFEKV